MKLSLPVYAGLLVVVGAVAAVAPRFRSDSQATQAARQFLASLEPAQAKKARYDFDNPERFNWHFVPKDRNGLSFKEMTTGQRQAATTLLRAGASADGVKRLETLRQMENVLKEIEQGRGPVRDAELYFVTVFGEPSDKGIWGWRYEGHHVSLQWTVRDGKILADTPQFLGANPAEIREGTMKGTRLLAKEEDGGYALANSLTADQRKAAILATAAPNDIITGNQRKAAILEDRGIAFSQLDAAQKKMLETLIAQHAALQAPELARLRLTKLRHAGKDSIKFAWMGSLERRQGHYYRIQGKTFLIEFDNTQNNANHIHTVWRDFNGDFGDDLLAEHYRAGSRE